MFLSDLMRERFFKTIGCERKKVIASIIEDKLLFEREREREFVRLSESVDYEKLARQNGQPNGWHEVDYLRLFCEI